MPLIDCSVFEPMLMNNFTIPLSRDSQLGISFLVPVPLHLYIR